MSGVLYLVGTPIGNLGDITLRALEILKSVDLIAAEDTRQTRKLLNHYGIEKAVTSYHHHNRYAKGARLLEELKRGATIALVSGAGMPGISDPGADLVKACVGEDIKISVIPGPSALITGLTASGLDTGSFIYCGFFPRHKKERKILLENLRWEERTLIFYESPRRLVETLRDMGEAWGDRPCCVARELTKVFEEYRRGTISKILAGLAGQEIKGEITLVVAGQKKEAAAPNWAEAAAMVEKLVQTGLNRKAAVKETAKALGVSKRELYAREMKQDRQ